MISATPTPTAFDLPAALTFASITIPSITIPPITIPSITIPSITFPSIPPLPSLPSLLPFPSDTHSRSVSNPPHTNPHTSQLPSQTVTSVAITSSTGSIGGASPATKTQGSTHRNTVPTPALIGIVLGISSMIFLAVFLLWLKRRRQRKSQVVHEYADVTTPFDIAAAFADSAVNSDARNITQVRRQSLRSAFICA
ncbi:hypothetical protein B0H16DRAFT_45020 [Mycena metata]|uniref:Uncharacterized protein n=1 Tax=Mycena metata TaxID=1033252 RepID=A0AAD7K043_9AGAR|nr:hypothetical protein B0H16DRAFT_45020 [Mycena metata]